MPMPKEEYRKEYVQAWRTYTQSLEMAVARLEADIEEAADMADTCTEEWCQATEHVIDELSNALFSISEPRWADREDSDKIKKLKRRVHDLYADYRGLSAKVPSA